MKYRFVGKKHRFPLGAKASTFRKPIRSLDRSCVFKSFQLSIAEMLFCVRIGSGAVWKWTPRRTCFPDPLRRQCKSFCYLGPVISFSFFNRSRKNIWIIWLNSLEANTAHSNGPHPTQLFLFFLSCKCLHLTHLQFDHGQLIRNGNWLEVINTTAIINASY